MHYAHAGTSTHHCHHAVGAGHHDLTSDLSGVLPAIFPRWFRSKPKPEPTTEPKAEPKPKPEPDAMFEPKAVLKVHEHIGGPVKAPWWEWQPRRQEQRLKERQNRQGYYDWLAQHSNTQYDLLRDIRVSENKWEASLLAQADKEMLSRREKSPDQRLQYCNWLSKMETQQAQELSLRKAAHDRWLARRQKIFRKWITQCTVMDHQWLLEQQEVHYQLILQQQKEFHQALEQLRESTHHMLLRLREQFDARLS